MYTSYGLRSLYGGYSSGLVAYFIYRGIQIGGYDTMKTHYGLELQETPDIKNFNNSIFTSKKTELSPKLAKNRTPQYFLFKNEKIGLDMKLLLSRVGESPEVQTAMAHLFKNFF